MKFYIIGLVLGLLLGIAGTILVIDNDDGQVNEIKSYQKNLDGFYYSEVSREKVDEYIEEKDPHGDWVCINVRDMKFPRGYETCVHECSHAAFDEMFAEICENDPEECYKMMEELLNEK